MRTNYTNTNRNISRYNIYNIYRYSNQKEIYFLHTVGTTLASSPLKRLNVMEGGVFSGKLFSGHTLKRSP